MHLFSFPAPELKIRHSFHSWEQRCQKHLAIGRQLFLCLYRWDVDECGNGRKGRDIYIYIREKNAISVSYLGKFGISIS